MPEHSADGRSLCAQMPERRAISHCRILSVVITFGVRPSGRAFQFISGTNEDQRGEPCHDLESRPEQGATKRFRSERSKRSRYAWGDRGPEDQKARPPMRLF